MSTPKKIWVKEVFQVHSEASIGYGVELLLPKMKEGIPRCMRAECS